MRAILRIAAVFCDGFETVLSVLRAFCDVILQNACCDCFASVLRCFADVL